MCLSRSQSLFPAEIFFFVTKTWGGGDDCTHHPPPPTLIRGGMHPPLSTPLMPEDGVRIHNSPRKQLGMDSTSYMYIVGYVAYMACMRL